MMPGVDLHQRGAGVDLLARVGAGQDAADADDRQRAVERAGQRRHDGGGPRPQGCAGEAAGLVGVRPSAHGIARDRRVGGDHAVDPEPDEQLRDPRQRRVVEVGRDLDRDRRVLAVPVGELRLLVLQRRQQRGKRLLVLQFAQPLGVGRAHVDRDVVGARVHAAQAGKVIVDRALVGRVEVLADVETEHASVLRPRDVGEERVEPLVVEAHPVDQRLGLDQAEQSRLRVAGLRTRRDGAAFDVAEAERGQAVDVLGILVEAGREADAVREPEPHHLDRVRRHRGQHEPGEPAARGGVEAREGDVVRDLRIEREQHRAKERVEVRRTERHCGGRRTRGATHRVQGVCAPSRRVTTCDDDNIRPR